MNIVLGPSQSGEKGCLEKIPEKQIKEIKHSPRKIAYY
jgi:hypothetical protein